MKKTPPLAGRALVDSVVERATERKAENIVLLDLSDSPGAAQWFVLCQGDNTVHCKAIADDIVRGLKVESTAPWYVEGQDHGRWVLIDYSDVVVHVMLPEVREYYNLEKLWKNARREDVETDEE